ncbi:zinc-binding alcohol dehydrogenase family protein [Pedobacter cryophilus]|uniref:Zinc-binding alcohol dehydrogenase family protein n=1 Tax=Pedobacter cryophilus TaxID=2571271 RepID=A0A4U1C2G5_9SPHI|nr:zinc-binding alcohol dehydrogenase family protein [Pedobacter cryophilus]TKB99217.1 zinc-binding alcohol dehydrogenase family protein [Pedobacter cryophilus]
MKILYCNQPGAFSYAEKALPEIKPGEALIKIKRIGICGTDYHAFGGSQPFFTYPRVLGHELAGELIDFSDAPGFKKGEAVTIIPYFNCKTCIACRTGKPNCCQKINVFGVHIDGGMAEYVVVPSYSLVHSQGLSFDDLALVEPLAIGAHGIKRAQVQAGEFILVIGAGPIGLGTMEFAKVAGAKVIAMDTNTMRLDFCKHQLGVEFTVNPATENAIEKLLNITNGDMPTAIFDATGNLKAINNGINYLAHGGRYVLIGLQKEAFSFSHPEFHKRESTLMSSRNATREDFEHVISSIKKGLVNSKTYITHRLSFDEVKDQFEMLLKPESGVIKAMINFF